MSYHLLAQSIADLALRDQCCPYIKIESQRVRQWQLDTRLDGLYHFFPLYSPLFTPKYLILVVIVVVVVVVVIVLVAVLVVLIIYY